MSDWGRPELRDLAPYTVSTRTYPVKLDANEAPADFPPELKDEVLRRLMDIDFSRYPEKLAGELQTTLGEFLGVGSDKILLGNGSDELIQMLALAFGTGRKVLYPAPTFSMYRLSALIAGAEPVAVPLTANFGLDAESLIAAAEGEPGLIFICNPNNPTGNSFPTASIERILQETRAVVAVDEAYADYAGQSLLPLVERYERLVILRTFSKAFGLAGIRVGYAVAGPGLLSELAKVKPPYSLNCFALAVAKVAVEYPGYRQERIVLAAEERERVCRRLQALSGIQPYPSETNFILFRAAGRGAAVGEALRARGIAIRSFGRDEMLTDCLRVSIGSKSDNDRFLTEVSSIMDSQPEAEEGGKG